MGDDVDPASGPGGSFSQRVTRAPLSSRPSRLAPATSKPDSEAPPSVGSFDGEDFLYHLYRGSELLQDNLVPQAKEELERALKLQPQDTEGQGLLGVVYFRLGLYPRAIGIYEEIIKACPNEVSPRVNLGLCYLKTGQSHLARDALEEVIQRVPEHVRAWGYLGLTFERLGELAKAEAAFEKAGQPNLARRMQRLLAEQAQAQQELVDPERASVRLAAADAVQELDGREGGFSRAPGEDESDLSRSGRWRAVELGDASVPPLPKLRRSPSLVGRLGPAVPAINDAAELGRDSVPPPTSFRPPLSIRAPIASSGALAIEGGVAFPEPPAKVLIAGARIGTCVTADGFAARSDVISSVIGGMKALAPSPLMRRARGRETSEPFGAGSTVWHLYEGEARAIIIAGPARMLWALELADEFVYVRETSLLAFESTVRYENGRLAAGGREPVAMVQLSGKGFAVLETHGAVSALSVGQDTQAVVRVDDVIGWTGRLLGQAVDTDNSPGKLPGAVSFSGEGALLLDLTR
ncbi:MAG: tetratricopeptide repeat protein [Myxococcales bacterium]|nr:MAG: tetratricopeptide repeat protein [Myxococcales bacterium]